MSVERATLRRAAMTRREAIPASRRIAAANDLALHLAALPGFPGQGFVAGYWAMRGEIALHAWQLSLPGSLVYCLPILHEDQRLRFAPWRPGEPLVANRYGIPEPHVDPDALLAPEAMAAVVLPLVAFDDAGNRLGMGAGWYDRSFGFRLRAPAPPLLVGAAFAEQRVDHLDAEAWDVPLDAICTEQGSRVFAVGVT